jgi:uncharacterized protein involved in oxidation of intracellular sulfur
MEGRRHAGGRSIALIAEANEMAKNLFILNDPPYGTERSYNALRLALALAKTDGEQVRVFLMGDGAPCAKAGQKVPQGYYNLGDMLGMVARRNVEIGVCGTCMDARGITDSELVPGAGRGTLAQLAEWTVWADKVLVF